MGRRGGPGGVGASGLGGLTTGPDTWRAILSVARRAPSPHNVQPWRVRLVSDRAAELFIDGARTLPNEDTTGSFLLSAMGMLIEAIDLVAAGHGLRLQAWQHGDAADVAALVSRPGARGLIPFARLDLVDAAGVQPEYDEALFLARRTSRIPLRPDPVPAIATRRLADLSAQWGHAYAQLSTPEAIEPAVDRNIDAVFHDMNVPHYHDEITEWFRYTRRATERTQDGLDWRCMNLSRVEFWLSARLPGLLRFPPSRAVFKRRYRRQLWPVPAIGVLAGNFFDPREAVHAGRFLMRFWLEVARLGLAMHPYGNLVTNPDAASWFSRHTGIPDAWLIFKLGASDVPPLSKRRDVEDILLPAGDAA